MAVGIRSGASTGSYGSSIANLNPDMGVRQARIGGLITTIATTAQERMPDFIGGEQGTVYFDWKAVDEANGYDYGANGKVLGSSKRGYETAAERERRLADRRKVWSRFVNNIKGSANRVQRQNNSLPMYTSRYNKAIRAGKTPAQAAVIARRHVNEKEQNEIARIAKKSGLKIALRTNR